MHAADGMGKHQGGGSHFENVAVRCISELKEGAVCGPRPFFLMRHKDKNLDSLRQAGHAAIHKDHRADHHRGRKQHVKRNRFASQEPS